MNTNNEEEERDNLIIHDECGLDIELCICPDAKFYYDEESGMCVERSWEEIQVIRKSMNDPQ